MKLSAAYQQHLSAVAQLASDSPTFRLFASLFFAALALVFAGLFVLMLYEVLAIATGTVPTISNMTAIEYLKHPVAWVSIACLVSFALGALVTHFTHWTP